MPIPTNDWLNQPIQPPPTQPPRWPQPDFPPPQIPWDLVLRALPWALVAFGLVFWIANRTPTEQTGVTGLRVLVIEETEQRGDLTPEQIAIFNSVEIREAIEAADGQVLFLDADDRTRDLAPEWARLRERIRSRPPVVVFANPRRAKEMPLPADVQTFVEALEGFK